MQNVTTLKTRGQETLNRLVEAGKQQPPEVQTWGVTAAGAVVGGLVLAAGAQGLLAIVAMLAAPPVALTIGVLGGGAAAWSFMQHRSPQGETDPEATASRASVDATPEIAHAEEANA